MSYEYKFSSKAAGDNTGIFARLTQKRDELLAAGRKVYNLYIGTPDFPTPEHIVRAVSEAASKAENFKYALTDLQVYDGAAADDYLPLLIFIGNAYKFEIPQNRLGFTPDVVFKNITLCNIRVNAHRMPQSIIKTLDGYMRTENVKIDGVYLNGKRMEDAGEMNLDAPEGSYQLL